MPEMWTGVGQNMEGRDPVLEGENSEKKGGEGGEMEVVVQGEEEVLRREISCHPMFGLLKETHLNCLKICSGEQEEVASVKPDQVQRSNNTAPENHTDLDLFMEAYYTALVELTQAIQKPMQEATAFIEFMYCALDDIASEADASGGAAAGK